MRYVTFTSDHRQQVGLLEGDAVRPLVWQGELTDWIASGQTPALQDVSLPLSTVKLEAPLIPGKIIAVGKNYGAHAKEMGGEVPELPLLFSKYPSAVIGQGDVITWKTSLTDSVDWEGELAVVIGRQGKEIPEDEAFDYVFGYTAANDVSARDLQNRIDKQWTRAKGLDTFCPLGPCLVTRDEIADPHQLSVRTTVNGAVMQDGNTQDMIYSIPRLIAFISQAFTLKPGDLILTGTPSGVGAGRTPPVFLKDGDEVSVTVGQIGTLTNRCQVREG